MSSPTRCYNCMSITADADLACPSCGWTPENEPDSTLYLPMGYLLNNRYLIGKVIGVGGFGIVYVAWDNNLDVRVAVKEFLAKDYAARSTDHISLTVYSGSAREEHNLGIEKFIEEAKSLAKFQDHPGIVKVNESFRANNTAYMVMQFLDGMTLKEYLKRQPGEKMPFNMAVKAMIPIMDALREVHNAGFVHRDISPDNIFITRQKQIKLLDFGSARYAIGEHSKSLTSVLKHGYAPVEQYSSKGNQGPWSDVYAVAATIYRAVTGEVPVDAMERIQDDTLKSPRQLGADIPPAGESAIMRGLALKAAERYLSIPEFQMALLERVAPNTQSASDAVVAPQPAEMLRRPTALVTTKSESDNYKDYGADTTNYRLLAIKTVAVIFIVIAVTYSLLGRIKGNQSTEPNDNSRISRAKTSPPVTNIDSRQPQSQPKPPTERVRVSSESYHSQALILVKNQYFEDLRRLIDNWVKDNPDDYYAWYFDGLYYFSFQNYARASDSLRKSLQLNPENPEAHILLGEVSIAKGDYAGGLVILNQCLKYNQRCPVRSLHIAVSVLYA